MFSDFKPQSSSRQGVKIDLNLRVDPQFSTSLLCSPNIFFYNCFKKKIFLLFKPQSWSSTQRQPLVRPKHGSLPEARGQPLPRWVRPDRGEYLSKSRALWPCTKPIYLQFVTNIHPCNQSPANPGQANIWLQLCCLSE